jgi:hypothetical protein
MQQRRTQVELAIVQEAGPKFGVAGQPHPAARAAKRFGDRVDKPNRPLPARNSKESRGGAWVGRDGLEFAKLLLNECPELPPWHKALFIRIIVGVLTTGTKVEGNRLRVV